jgi:hypothetical protein
MQNPLSSFFKKNRSKSQRPDFDNTIPEQWGESDHGAGTEGNAEGRKPQLAFQAEKRLSPKEWIVEKKIPLSIGAVVLIGGALYLHNKVQPKKIEIGPSTTVLDPQSLHTKAKPKVAVSVGASGPGQMRSASAPVDAGSTVLRLQDEAEQQARALIDSSSHGSARVISAKAAGNGLVAVTYSAQGRNGLAWVDTQHKIVILGTVLDAQGQNLQSGGIALASAASAPAPAASGAQSGATPMAGTVDPAMAVQQAMRTAVGVTAGNKAGIPLWIFVDPDSRASAHFYMNSKDALRVANVTWIPVSYEDTQSVGRVASILTQINPEKALDFNYQRFNYQASKGGIDAGNPSTSMIGVALKNTQLLSSVSTLQTPTVMFCGKDGAPHVISTPTDIGAVLRIAGPCRNEVN